MNPVRGPCGQRGVVLVIGMVILVIMTLMVLSSVTMSTSNVRATTNMQFRDAAFAAANLAIEQVVSAKNPTFMEAPEVVPLNPVNVDMDQDAMPDYVVVVPEPECTWWRIKKQSELDPTKEEDSPCYSGSRLAGVGGANPSSFCADTMWEVRAPVEDTQTGAEVAVNQGISVRMSVDLAGNACD